MTRAEWRLAKVLDRHAWLEHLRRVTNLRFDRGDGLPPASARMTSVGSFGAWLATLFIATVGLWEISGPFGAGHYSAATAVATAGENMLRFHILAPVASYVAGPPAPADYYCHHPFGVFWTAASFVGLFGHHAWVCRLPAVLMSAAMPRLVYGAGRALYGPLAGGVAALGYVVLPITLAYANFFALEVPTMFGMAVASYATARFFQSERRRFAALALFGLSYAAACDWPGFFFDALVLGGIFLRVFVLARFLPPFRLERVASFWAFGVVLVSGLAAYHLFEFVRLEHVSELLRQGEFRSNGSTLPLSDVLHQRRYWLTLAFTPLAIVIGKLALPVLVARLVLERRGLELLPLAVLATASAQYVVFKEGADIHFFWPQYFALYFAYAVAALVATLDRAIAWTAGHLPAARRDLSSWLGAALGLSSVLAIVPDGLVALVYARQTGGRFNEKGLIIHSDFDKAAALAAIAPSLPEGTVFGLASSMKPSYWMDWVLRREVRYVGLPRLGSSGVTAYAMDARFDTRGALESLAREFPVRAIGPFLVADTRALAAPILGYGLVERKLPAFERFFVATSHPVYDVVPDPFWTWELREHLGQQPNPPPTGTPASNEELRVAHNFALRSGDTAGAARYEGQLLTGVDRRAARSYAGGVELLGVRVESAASPRVTLYFRTSAQLPTDVEFRVSSTVTAARRYSLVPKDELVWDVGMPFAIRTSLWRPGFIYSSITELTRRPGSEQYDGSFHGPIAPVPLHGQARGPLFSLP